VIAAQFFSGKERFLAAFFLKVDIYPPDKTIFQVPL
jgi:hypothetical protein